MTKRIGGFNMTWLIRDLYCKGPKTYVTKIEISNRDFTLRRYAVLGGESNKVYHVLWTHRPHYKWYTEL